MSVVVEEVQLTVIILLVLAVQVVVESVDLLHQLVTLLQHLE
jgi:hypothetical protein